MRKHHLLRLAAFVYLFILSYMFTGVALAANGPNVSFAVMSDIHIHNKNTDVHQRLQRALTDYWRLNPQLDFIAINGDLTNGFPSHYDVLRRILTEVPHAPLHFTPGNHDFYKMLYNRKGELDREHLPNGWSSEKAIALFKQFTGYDKPYHDVWVNGYHFIFLANEKSRDFDQSIEKHGYISDKQLLWLQQQLVKGAGEANKPTFVFFHQPLPRTLSGSQYDVSIMQHQKLRRLLEQHPKVIFFSGHTHYSLRRTNQKYFDSFLMLGSSSIMRNEESLYVEVYDDYIDIFSRDHRRGEWIPNKAYRYKLF